MCLPLRQVVEAAREPYIEKESARSIADGAMMGGQRLRGAVVAPGAPVPTLLSAAGPARCESVLPQGLEGRDRTWPAHRSQLGLAQSSAQRPRCFPVPPEEQI